MTNIWHPVGIWRIKCELFICLNLSLLHMSCLHWVFPVYWRTITNIIQSRKKRTYFIKCIAWNVIFTACNSSCSINQATYVKLHLHFWKNYNISFYLNGSCSHLSTCMLKPPSEGATQPIMASLPCCTKPQSLSGSAWSKLNKLIDCENRHRITRFPFKPLCLAAWPQNNPCLLGSSYA